MALDAKDPVWMSKDSSWTSAEFRPNGRPGLGLSASRAGIDISWDSGHIRRANPSQVRQMANELNRAADEAEARGCLDWMTE